MIKTDDIHKIKSLLNKKEFFCGFHSIKNIIGQDLICRIHLENPNNLCNLDDFPECDSSI